ncbi:hypothetical protein [Paraburkholderia ribeironis]|uniref:hypothetical protein n=1 Tax=Paraburkholderia ribeironis TaxID=1247936 RepID=UPI001FE3E5C8|nr:hypothetical protein [Paraburkholderia ribeironis]
MSRGLLQLIPNANAGNPLLIEDGLMIVAGKIGSAPKTARPCHVNVRHDIPTNVATHFQRAAEQAAGDVKRCAGRSASRRWRMIFLSGALTTLRSLITSDD